MVHQERPRFSIDTKWRDCVRSNFSCPICLTPVEYQELEEHVELAHASEMEGFTPEEKRDWTRLLKELSIPNGGLTQTDTTLGQSGHGETAPTTTGALDKREDQDDDDNHEFYSGNNVAQPPAPDPVDSEPDTTMIRQLEPNPDPILPSQLATEVKAIYAGLVMVEEKCIKVVRAQTSELNGGRTLAKNQWQALITLHKTLLNEHYDFFLASQHPAASQPLKRLPSKYTMPVRMWRNGIHSFLELLRHSLPGSLEYMLTFIYAAYSTITLLYEAIPEYKDTWVECLGDLARYRMAVEDENMRDRDTWTGVSRGWYTMASNSTPAVGRLYHHLAILTRPHPVQQLSYYAKSVCVSLPFPSARDSANTFIAPHLTTPPGPHARVTVCEGAFIRCHGVIFTESSQHKFDSSLEEFRLHLDKHITTYNKSAEQGCQMAIANTCALMGFGSEGNAITRVLRARGRDDELDPESAAKDADQSSIILDKAIRLNYATNLVILKRTGDANVLPYLHVVLAFMLHLPDSPLLFDTVERAMPWHALASMLNFLLGTHKTSRHETKSFPRALKGDSTPLPEDWFLRGFAWADKYLPEGWFDQELAEADDSLRFLPHAFTKLSVNADRQERILWIGARMAESGNVPLTYDHDKHMFGTREGYEPATEVEEEELDS